VTLLTSVCVSTSDSRSVSKARGKSPPITAWISAPRFSTRLPVSVQTRLKSSIGPSIRVTPASTVAAVTSTPAARPVPSVSAFRWARGSDSAALIRFRSSSSRKNDSCVAVPARMPMVSDMVDVRPFHVPACFSIAPPKRLRSSVSTFQTALESAPAFWSRSISLRAWGLSTASSWSRCAASPNGRPAWMAL
jgi:hypothetical protein